ncbi:Na(+)-translocating NADH-quinone reductase subunit B [Marinomonas spartinae]|uniref:Na(+)-translocating NADH-quinone reductase subunit B n=1 Tax=Marinomonas spartinae TaxID=1792290 RepID=A0A1A8TVG7_9GAMM|nr:RnfABCDGE type electron transport complex subunit D [Marinomonas spartinae]SBS37355.1 Na(+)-translocating NADH-quinone reductase subunit B [Marinomonas spartinae]SBS39064.1 Na(+)-translocating NADH-quinone reductase subunit B [Marinomonas spartinae]
MKIITKFIIAIVPVMVLGLINQMLTYQPTGQDDRVLIFFVGKCAAIALAGGLFYLIYYFYIEKVTAKLTIKSTRDIIFSGIIFLCIVPYHIAYLDVFVCFLIGNLISTVKIKHQHYLFYLNGAIASRLVLFIIHLPMIHYSQYHPDIDGISSATPLLKLALTHHFDLTPHSSLSLKQLFLGQWQGSIGETSKLGLCLSCVLLRSLKLIKILPILVGLIASAISYALFHQEIGLPLNSYLSFILMGGFIFGLIFMTSDLFTSRLSLLQRCLYVMCIGFLCITYRAFLPFPEGMLLAIISSQAIFALAVAGKHLCSEIWKHNLSPPHHPLL